MSEDEAFIRTIVDSPGDDLPRLVYADYLDERNDPRGTYLRVEVNWAKTRQTTGFLVLRLQGLAEALDPVWVARVSRPPEGVCCDHLKFIECGPQLTIADVTALEGRLGVRFPHEFTGFLLNYNAGRVTPTLPAPPDKPVPVCDDIGYGFHPVGHQFDMVLEFEYTHYLNGRDLRGHSADAMSELVPLARVNDDDSLFLGVGGERAGKVYYFDGYDHDWFDPHGLSERAASLPKYLATLTTEWVHA